MLAVKGRKRVSGGSNNGLDNIISNGSVIAVADGQCMMIVEQGKVVDVCAEPGEYIYDISTEPSLFAGGNLSSNIMQVFQTIGKRFTFGGVAPKDQRVYYFNTKELVGNKYGTPSPRPPASILTSPSAALANTATASRTRCCSIRTSAAMWKRPIPATRSTASSRLSS